jgi:uncharacterized protein (DUF2267 family)
VDDLIKLVSQKAGIPTDKAQTAVTTVLDFLKEKLPPQYASQLDRLVSGGGGDIAGSIGGLFGKK